METPIDRIAADVVKGVVHPPHIPFHRKAEPANVCGSGHARPGSRLLSDGDDARDHLVHGGVHLLEELHRLQILPSAVGIWTPATVGTRVVQIEHGRHRIDPESVDVKLAQPVQRVGHQEVPHLRAPEVENVGTPVELFTAARIRVLVEGGAVEAAQCPAVLGKVRRNPVHDDTDAGLVQRIHEEAKIVGGAESRCRRIVGRHLVTPGSTEGMFGNR